jgi:nucleotide-binding universal stress UspA family protein
MEERATDGTAAAAAGHEAIFSQIVVGIDDTPESLIAAAQAGVLRAPEGTLVLLGVAERYLAAHAGAAALDADDKVTADTREALESAKELADADEALLMSGRLIDLLRGECGRRGTTLVAVGARPHRRVAALTFGGHDIEALHDLECSVLIARPGWGPAKPEKVVVGIDGSAESRRAEAAARGLARRIGCAIVPVIGLDDHVDHAVLREERDDAVLAPGHVLDAVVAVATTGSLVVAGRGRARGRRWGGDAAEKLVYSARCSVLVVRYAAG